MLHRKTPGLLIAIALILAGGGSSASPESVLTDNEVAHNGVVSELSEYVDQWNKQTCPFKIVAEKIKSGADNQKGIAYAVLLMNTENPEIFLQNVEKHLKNPSQSYACYVRSSNGGWTRKAIEGDVSDFDKSITTELKKLTPPFLPDVGSVIVYFNQPKIAATS